MKLKTLTEFIPTALIGGIIGFLIGFGVEGTFYSGLCGAAVFVAIGILFRVLEQVY